MLRALRWTVTPRVCVAFAAAMEHATRAAPKHTHTPGLRAARTCWYKALRGRSPFAVASVQLHVAELRCPATPPGVGAPGVCREVCCQCRVLWGRARMHVRVVATTACSLSRHSFWAQSPATVAKKVAPGRRVRLEGILPPLCPRSARTPAPLNCCPRSRHPRCRHSRRRHSRRAESRRAVWPPPADP